MYLLRLANHTFHHPYDSSIGLGFSMDWNHFFAILQTINLTEDKLMTALSACNYKVIRDDSDPNRIELQKFILQQIKYW